MLAHAVVAGLAARGHEVIAYDRADLDVTDAGAARRAIGDSRPDAVVQCAAYTRVDDAETEEHRAHEVNALAAANVAAACREAGARLVYPSTDYVFDGTASTPYSPDAPTAPLNAYGRSKLAGEAACRGADSLVVRTSWLYGAGGRSFPRMILRRARAGERLRVVDDQRGAPTFTRDLATVIVQLLEQRAPAGTYHATNAGHTTWFGFASAILDRAGVAAVIEPCSSADFPARARRPAWSVLDCSATYALVGELPCWRQALAAALPDLVAA
jgi:dTDP-4-dehydrorhamnose reductase